MGRCFKLFGKAKTEQNVVDCTGSTFFVAEHYLLTCKHNVSALSPGDELSFCFGDKKYSAELVEVAENWDLALLYTETSAERKWIFPLDRIAPEGRGAIAYGYPHGGALDEQRGLVIGTELDNGVANLTNANGVTIGFSGGPVCRSSDKGTAVGVIITIKGRDELGRQVETAGFVFSRVALELWGKKYNLCEKRYEVRTEAYGSNSFVYSEQKTEYQDPHNYLELLQGFLNDSSPVLWQAVVGPGGSGKSRLCFELACSLDSKWCCKLLRFSQLKKVKLQNLYEEAGKDFLLLADYAYADTGELGDWLDECARARDAEDRPRIRVLLLQREKGRKDFGWQQSLMRGHGNLINLRYQEDLELAVLGKNEMTALMRSYAENEAGRQINAEELYEVLQSVDPGLSRPLFAMFITDAVLKGDDPRNWDQESALAYFTKRENDVVDNALSRLEDMRAAKLLLALATITDGLTFKSDMLNSPTLCEIREFVELPEKERFGIRLNDARLANWEHGCCILKPLKPDLLGEYYVLDIFREMMREPKRKEVVTSLLNTAKETDMVATIVFLVRFFNDYKIDEEIRSICFDKKDGLFRFSVIHGEFGNPNTELLRDLYKVFKTDPWVGYYASALGVDYSKEDDLEKQKEMLNEIRMLSRYYPQSRRVAQVLAYCLFLDNIGSKRINDDPAELDEIRMIHKEHPQDTRIAKKFVESIVYSLVFSFRRDSVSVKRSILLKDLREIYMKEPKNTEVAEMISIRLGQAFIDLYYYREANIFLNELRTLHTVYHGNVLIAGKFAYGLSCVLELCSDEIDGKALLEELRELYRDYPDNYSITKALADGLSNVIALCSDEIDGKALLEELRVLYGNHPSTAESFAKGLNAAIFNVKIGKKNILLKELRELHKDYPDNDSITKAFALGLSIVLIGMNAGYVLLEELRELHRNHPDNDLVKKAFAIGLSNAMIIESIDENVLLKELRTLHTDQPDDALLAGTLADGLYRACFKFSVDIDGNALLEELRTLYRNYPDNDLVSGALTKGLFITFYKQSNPKKDCILLDEPQALQGEQPNKDHTVGAIIKGVFNSFYKKSNSKKTHDLLDEFRMLYKGHIGNKDVAEELANDLSRAIFLENNPEKASALQDIIRALHEELPENEKVTRTLSYSEVQITTRALLVKNGKMIAELKKAQNNKLQY